MDRINIPACALHRQSTTVIVRMKMEVTGFCSRADGCPATGCPKIVHRPTGCEQCSRTRLVSQYSDCDSGIVERCRPYKSSAARSRYVNVCAAVCLLLLIGVLSPRSYAAPFRSRAMDRQKRASEEENYLWRNPCSYNDTNSGAEYTPKIAKNVAQQAKNALEQAETYKELFAKLHSFDSYENLLKEWNDDWLRKFPWVANVLPDKNGEIETSDASLPVLYKALKMIVASLHKLSKSLEQDGINEDAELASNISNTMKDTRAVLCYFYDLMKSRHLEILPVYDSEIPDINKSNKLEMGLYIYRDTLNYLQHITTAFQKMSEETH